MPEQIRIYLVRHGESEANLDNAINALKADHEIELSPAGVAQADVAGLALARHLAGVVLPAEYIAGNHGPLPVRLWQSPYRRTRATADGLAAGLASLGDAIRLDRRESDLLREQEFGLFDGVCDADLPQLFPHEHALYEKYEKAKGRYFARMPMGESRCDVAQRCRLFFGTLMRDLQPTNHRPGIRTVVLSTHGVTARCFLKEWFHRPYEWIEAEKNPRNASIHLIENGVDLGVVHAGGPSGKGHYYQELRESGDIS